MKQPARKAQPGPCNSSQALPSEMPYLFSQVPMEIRGAEPPEPSRVDVDLVTQTPRGEFKGGSFLFKTTEGSSAMVIDILPVKGEWIYRTGWVNDFTTYSGWNTEYENAKNGLRAFPNMEDVKTVFQQEMGLKFNEAICWQDSGMSNPLPAGAGKNPVKQLRPVNEPESLSEVRKRVFADGLHLADYLQRSMPDSGFADLVQKARQAIRNPVLLLDPEQVRVGLGRDVPKILEGASASKRVQEEVSKYVTSVRQLIRSACNHDAYTCPEWSARREALSKALDETEGLAGRKNTGAVGLRRMNQDVTVDPGTELYLGASSDPDHVLILHADARKVYFKKIPIYADSKVQEIEAQSFQMLARTGTRKKLDSLEHFQKSKFGQSCGNEEWIQTQIDHLRKVLAGESTRVAREEDYFYYHVKVKAPGIEGDAWNYLDSITGGCCNGYNLESGEYEITVFGNEELGRVSDDPKLVVTETKHESRTDSV